MNENQNMEMHYMNTFTGFPYAVTDGYVDFFHGSSLTPLHYAHTPPVQDQEAAAAYWGMNMNAYKFGLPGPGTTPYYGFYEPNDHVPRMDFNRRVWEYPSVMNVEEPSIVDTPPEENAAPSMHAIPEECSPDHQDEPDSQVLWQDDIDPDNMTYEELLDLGEAVGTESRGLSQELIDLLPTSKYKSGGIFSRKKSAERCVICQMRYKRGDRQINLPCKHIYHTDCGSKWLSINKTCPVCNKEVFGEESSN